MVGCAGLAHRPGTRKKNADYRPRSVHKGAMQACGAMLDGWRPDMPLAEQAGYFSISRIQDDGAGITD